MPEPVGRGQRYIPGLDGLRAIAVAAVLAYHLGAGWAPGGVLGVAVFFTLSGYLITDLLLSGFDTFGFLRLKKFCMARARRLLPPFLVMLVVVVAWVTIFDPDQLSHLRGMVVASVLYVSNWYLISEQMSYFARFGPPNPLGHLWSLAVEEQFYLVWPFMVFIGLKIFRPRRSFSLQRGRLALVTLGLAAVSAIAMAVMYSPGIDTTRIYEGTDTRAFGLLFGAALAMVWPSRRIGRTLATKVPVRRGLDVLGAVGLLVIVLMIWKTNDYGPFLYRGGLVLLSVATVLVVAAIVHPDSRLGKIIGCRPLRWIGVRSYAIYLWHFPIIVLGAAHPQEAPSLLRALIMTALTVALAALSWTFVEDPIRRGALRRMWANLRSGAWVSGISGTRTAAGLTALALLVVAGIGVSGKVPSDSTATASTASAPLPNPQLPDPPLPDPGPSSTSPASTTSPSASTSPGPSPSSSPTASASPSVAPVAARSSCKTLVHIGDSTSEGLTSSAYLPDVSQQSPAQYAAVGVTNSRMEISGGRSILETVGQQQNAYNLAKSIIAGGYKGCWVLALGTNDTADVAVGSVMNQATRIKNMMEIIGDQPVLWTSVRSLLSSGPYSETQMQVWNNELKAACSKYPSMRVYDWASVVQNAWFGQDSVHFTSFGYAQRAHGLAQGLAHAFPADGKPSSNCFVT